jgi:DNA-binding IclR family transcriptional regulator
MVSEASESTEQPPRRIRAVANAANILHALADSARPLNAGELATRVGLARTSVYHLLRTMEAERFVARDDDGRYRLSWGLYELGNSVSDSMDLTRVVRRHLDSLSEATSEAALLAILEGESVLYLDRGQADIEFQMMATPGRRGSLHATASGKLLLAFQPPEFIERVLARGLSARTARTIVDPATLLAQLEIIRETEVAECWQEQEAGLNSFAVPLRDYTSEVCAALTLVSTSHRITPENLPWIRTTMLEHAARASAELGNPTRERVRSRGPRRPV